MKVLGVEVRLNNVQTEQIVQQIKEVYPEVYGYIYNEGFIDGQNEEACDFDVCCHHCGNELDRHCFNCDPYPN